ncbi:MAG TPA: UpxY family transcription antiterminator [Bryobacteraceae bacterium]|nr:UpxY family transcription antiterminator [Bryobacteraceae bacterium]
MSRILDIGARNITAWYAVRTRSNFERRAATELIGKGLNVFLPSFRELHQWKDRKKVVEQPLFPGYLFAHIADTAEARLAILKAPGVVQILGQGQSIEPVPDDQVEGVRAMLTASVPCFAHPFLREGSRVRIRRGALKGIEGFLVRFKNQFRLVLTVELLNQSVATEVDVQDVEPLGSSLVDQRRIA